MLIRAGKVTTLSLVLFGFCGTLLIINLEGWAEDPFLRVGPRSLALGEAMTGVIENEDLLFYNPAALAMWEDSQLTLIGLRVNLNADTLDTIDEFAGAYGDAEKPPGGKNYDRIDDFSQTRLETLGDLQPLARFAGPIQITYLRQGFGLSLINPEILGRIDVDAADSKIHFRGRGDVLGMVSYARKVYQNLSVGLTVKYLVRSEIGQDGRGPKLTDVLDEDANIFLKRGFGYDVGIAYEMERFPVTIGFALLDFTGTTLTVQERELDGFGKVGPDQKSKVDGRFALGVAYRPDFKIPIKRLAYMPADVLLALAFTSGDSFGEQFHLGIEVKPYRWAAFRFGIHDGVHLGIAGQRGRVQFGKRLTSA